MWKGAKTEMTGSLYRSNITGFLSSASVVMGKNKCNSHNVIYQQIRRFWRMFSIREALKKKLFKMFKWISVILHLYLLLFFCLIITLFILNLKRRRKKKDKEALTLASPSFLQQGAIHFLELVPPMGRRAASFKDAARWPCCGISLSARRSLFSFIVFHL